MSLPEFMMKLEIKELSERLELLQKVCYQLTKKLGGEVNFTADDMKDPEMGAFNILRNAHTKEIQLKNYLTSEQDRMVEDCNRRAEEMDEAFKMTLTPEQQKALEQVSDLFAGIVDAVEAQAENQFAGFDAHNQTKH